MGVGIIRIGWLFNEDVEIILRVYCIIVSCAIQS